MVRNFEYIPWAFFRAGKSVDSKGKRELPVVIARDRVLEVWNEMKLDLRSQIFGGSQALVKKLLIVPGGGRRRERVE